MTTTRTSRNGTDTLSITISLPTDAMTVLIDTSAQTLWNRVGYKGTIDEPIVYEDVTQEERLQLIDDHIAGNRGVIDVLGTVQYQKEDVGPDAVMASRERFKSDTGRG